MFNGNIPKFSKFLLESENKTESMRNYKAYLNGTEPLRHCIITHKEGDDAFDFVKSKMTKNFSVLPDDHWDKVLKKHRSQLDEVLKERNKK